MEEMTRKQPDVDKITKTHKRKAAVEPQIQSQIPVLGKGRTGSMYPTNTPRGAWPEPSGPVLSHCRVTRHPHLVHFSTWNDVIANLFFLITRCGHSHCEGFFIFHLQENGLPHKPCMHQQRKPPLRPRTPGLTCWSLSGSTCGCWLWTEGGNSTMPWTDWRR